ncbi:hypothetical protein HK104_001345 [Borealophlyctis nickersoniae]|nr:hypothetical protein HK104_001345 [Borealophlyctis nickersoniae]
MEGLIADLELSKKQAAEVEALLSAPGGENAELAALAQQLRTLVDLQEQALLSAKKDELLRKFGATENVSAPIVIPDDDDEVISIPDEEVVVIPDEEVGLMNSLRLGGSLKLDFCVDEQTGPSGPPVVFKEGEKCCIPFFVGAATYILPAMILRMGPGEEATVLVLTPVTKESRVCDWHLEGRCNRKKCERSHGIKLAVENLLPMEVLESAPLKEESPVLARYRDGVYYRAKITTVDSGVNGGFWVQYDGYGDDKVKLASDQIIPLVGVGLEKDIGEASDVDTGSSDSSGDEDEAVSVEGAKALSSTFHYDDGEKMGSWEAHTKGIGSRLLAKMGYQPGAGLGKAGEGIVRPVEAELVPTGKGLGHDGSKAHHQPKKRKRTGSDERNIRPGRVPKEKASNSGQAQAASFFDFLNTTLNKKPRKRRQ